MANNLYKIYVTSNGEWETIELDELNIDTVFSVEEITDISQRKDNITKSITLKGTKQNNKVLGALYSLDREVDSNPDTTNLMFNYKPNKYLDCFVLENNIEIIRGKLLITSVDVRKGVIYYNCNIVGNVFSFFSNLNDKNLEDLDSLDVPENRSIRYGRESIRGSWNANTPVGNLNMLILEDTTLGGILWTDGQISTGQDYASFHRYTDFIPANPSTPYTFTKTPNVGGGDSYFRIGFFGSGFNLIYRTTFQTAYNGETIISPAGTVYIRFSFPDRAENVKLEEGTEFTGYSRNPADYLDYVFPMINYGGVLRDNGEDVSWDASKRIVRWTDYKPAIYVRSYMDAMFNGWRYDEATDSYTQKNASGEPLKQFRWSSSLKNDYAFNRLIIPFNNDYWRTSIFDEEQFDTENGAPIFDYADGLWKPVDNYGPIDTEGWKPIYASTGLDLVFNDPWAGNVVTRASRMIHGTSYPNVIRIVKPFSGTITVNARVMFNGVADLPGMENPRARVAIVRINPSTNTFTDENVVADIIVQRNSRNDGPSDSSGENSTFTISYTGVLTGDYAVVLQRAGSNFNGFYLNADSYINLTGSGVAVFEMNWGERFNLINTVPTGYSCREFLKSVMLLNNLFMISDKEDDRLFHIYTYDEFNQKMLNRVNTGEAEDWSDKIDWESYSLSSNLKLAKGYDFTYKEAEDYWNEYYTENTGRVFGDYKLIDSAGLIESHTTEVMFNPTMNLNWKFNSQVPQLYKAETFGGGEPPESYKGDLRILYFVGGVKLRDDISAGNRGYDLVDEQGSRLDVFNPFNGYYGYASMNLYEITKDSNGNDSAGTMIDSLLFGKADDVTLSGDVNASVETTTEGFTNFQYDAHHRNRIRELTDPNLITMEAEAYLNEGDIARLDFRAPIYIQSPFGSAYFKLLRVEYSDSNSKSRVTLQKVVLPDSNIR